MPWGTSKKGKSLLCLPDQLLTSPDLYIRRGVARSKNLGGHIVMQGCRPLGCRGCHGNPMQILADQLTLSQPKGADYFHQIKLAPPDFQTFLWPCNVVGKICPYLQITGGRGAHTPTPQPHTCNNPDMVLRQ